jgi:hypothetical protein
MVTDNLGAPLLATISVDGVQVGISPQKIAVERGKTYVIEVRCEGYKPKKTVVSYDQQTEVTIALDPEDVPPQPVKTWWEKIIEWILNAFKR